MTSLDFPSSPSSPGAPIIAITSDSGYIIKIFRDFPYIIIRGKSDSPRQAIYCLICGYTGSTSQFALPRDWRKCFCLHDTPISAHIKKTLYEAGLTLEKEVHTKTGSGWEKGSRIEYEWERGGERDRKEDNCKISYYKEKFWIPIFPNTINQKLRIICRVCGNRFKESIGATRRRVICKICRESKENMKKKCVIYARVNNIEYIHCNTWVCVKGHILQKKSLSEIKSRLCRYNNWCLECVNQ